MDTLTTYERERLKTSIHRHARAWVEVYRQRTNAEHLIKSLLLGAQTGLQIRAGVLDKTARRCPPGTDLNAWCNGLEISERLPASLVALTRPTF